MTTAAPPPRERVELPFDRASAVTARGLLGDLVRSLGVGGTALDDVLIVVHELVVNALDHGRPDPANRFALSWAVEDRLLWVSVRDHGSEGVVAARELTMDDPRGRGLALVAAISTRWSVEREDGTEVSAWLPLGS